MVLDIRSHHAHRVLRTECQRPAVEVLERSHLLGYDIGLLAYAACEKLRFLEDRRADLLVVVRPAHTPGDRLDVVPHGGRGWEQVPCPFDGSNHPALASSSR